MNTKVDEYTIDELMDIIGIDTLTVKNVEGACRAYIQEFKTSNNQEFITFFKNIEKKLLDEIDIINSRDNDIDTKRLTNPTSSSGNVNDWFGTSYLQQNNQQQRGKISERENKVQIFDNGHVPMSREQLGIANNYQVKVGQDTLNPVLQNTVSRYIVIDSQYRQTSSGDGSTMNTDFTMDLSEHMVNVLSIRLSAIQIPFSWFNINSYRNSFHIYNRIYNASGEYTDAYYLIKINEGNYDTIDSILLAINNSFLAAGFTKTDAQNFIYLENGKVVINLFNTTINGNVLHWFDDNNTTSGYNNVSGIFFSPIQATELNVCSNNKIQRTQTDYENTLGWLLGYRQVAEYIYSYGNVAEAMYKINVFNYLILVIDDYNQNHINNGIVTITELSNRIPYNKYNTSNNPYYCIRNNNGGSFDPIKVLNNSLLNAPLSVILEKTIPPYNDIVHILPSAPRTLTQSQIYATNEIAKSNAQTTRYKISPPNNSDTFAILPISIKGTPFGSLITETGSTLQLNQRVYFGPVNLDRLRVKIMDDRGNLMDFNGIEWNMVIIADCLYQY
jgi:hypothetical protein